MTLTLTLTEHSRRITLAVKNKHIIWEEEADDADGLVKSLDKILKKANIEYNAIKKVHVTCPLQTSLTSFRLATTFKQALTIAISLKPRKQL